MNWKGKTKENGTKDEKHNQKNIKKEEKSTKREKTREPIQNKRIVNWKRNNLDKGRKANKKRKQK